MRVIPTAFLWSKQKAFLFPLFLISLLSFSNSHGNERSPFPPHKYLKGVGGGMTTQVL